MAYETVTGIPQYSGTINTISSPSYPQTIRPEPSSPTALNNLGKASQEYADAAAQFIAARGRLDDARQNWQSCRDEVAKVSEAEGI